jgi:hypothetical protein
VAALAGGDGDVLGDANGGSVDDEDADEIDEIDEYDADDECRRAEGSESTGAFGDIECIAVDGDWPLR